jgi:hypothetical protein
VEKGRELKTCSREVVKVVSEHETERNGYEIATGKPATENKSFSISNKHVFICENVIGGATKSSIPDTKLPLRLRHGGGILEVEAF